MTDARKNQVRHYLCGKNAFVECFHPLAHQFNNRLDALLKYEEDLLPFLATQAFCYSALNKSLIPPMLPSRLVAS